MGVADESQARQLTGESMEGESVNRPMKVLILTTGGTIEKTYDESDGSLQNRESVVERVILPLLRLPYTRIEVRSLLCKDSLDMTEQDRAVILQAVAESQDRAEAIVVLHGTDTMDQSARFCQKFLRPLKVPVVFTGAMKPIGFADSDAIQNISEALMVARIIAPGVYISFHNRLYQAERARKNRQLNTFEEGASVSKLDVKA